MAAKVLLQKASTRLHAEQRSHEYDCLLKEVEGDSLRARISALLAEHDVQHDTSSVRCFVSGMEIVHALGFQVSVSGTLLLEYAALREEVEQRRAALANCEAENIKLREELAAAR